MQFIANTDNNINNAGAVFPQIDRLLGTVSGFAVAASTFAVPLSTDRYRVAAERQHHLGFARCHPEKPRVTPVLLTVPQSFSPHSLFALATLVITHFLS